MVYRTYFRDYNTRKGLFYGLALLFVFSVMAASLREPFLNLDDDDTCRQEQRHTTTLTFGNPLYVYNPCRYQRFRIILWLTPEECCRIRRLIVSVVLGGVIGWERRQADRPAGIRTMALVSLGSALFTINSAYAFLSGPMEWDASRISAAIPSGVGFLGAGLIFKEAQKDEASGGVTHIVHGLTTAATLWISSAVGVACGGGLYMAASFCVAVNLVVLRFGPRVIDLMEENEMMEQTEGKDEHTEVKDEEAEDEKETTALYPKKAIVAGAPFSDEHSSVGSSHFMKRRDRASIRNRTQLGGIM